MKTESDRCARRIRTMPAIGFALTMLFVSVQSANAQWNPSPSPSPNTKRSDNRIGLVSTLQLGTKVRSDQSRTPATNRDVGRVVDLGSYD